MKNFFRGSKFFDLKILHPEIYHGKNRKHPFFEGWYYKIVDESEEHCFVIIPGIYKGQNDISTHCFVQFMDGTTGNVYYYRFDKDDFKFNNSEFDIHIGPNHFTLEQIEIKLMDSGGSNLKNIYGSLKFFNLTPWPVSFFSPGAMGLYAWVPYMECYHGILSLDHKIEGYLFFDGKEINFSNGRGYIEKDWGVGFPSAWIWFQSNHFSDCKFDKIYMDPAKISLTLSIAIVPFLKKKIKGFIVGLLLDDKLYKFTPYEGGILEKVLVDSKNVMISIKNNKHSMEIVINRTEQFGVLYAPDKEDMLPKVNESIFSKAVVNLYDNGNGKKLIFSGIARIGALELVGDIDKLITV